MTDLVERRTSPRVTVPYTVRLRGTDSTGQSFKEETQMGNLSTGGMYASLVRNPQKGSSVSVSVRLSTAPADRVSAVRLAARGTVVRVETQPGGAFGVAVQFTRRQVF